MEKDLSIYFTKLRRASAIYIDAMKAAKAKTDSNNQFAMQQFNKGDITEQGYKNALKESQNALAAVKADFEKELDAIKEEYFSAVDDYMMPNGAMLDTQDIALLDAVFIDTDEFLQLTKKHAGNPTMERVLFKYKNKHKIEANWRPENKQDIKQSFETLIIGVTSAANMNNSDEVNYLISKAYHKLRCSDDIIMPIPEGAASEFGGMPKTVLI